MRSRAATIMSSSMRARRRMRSTTRSPGSRPAPCWSQASLRRTRRAPCAIIWPMPASPILRCSPARPRHSTPKPSEASRPDPETVVAGMKKAVVRTALETLYFTGAHRMLAPLIGGVGAILTLHHVRPPRADAFQPNRLLEVSPQFLEDVLRELRRSGVDIVTLDEMHRRLKEQDFRRRFVCLTFDDGYRDNARYALPVLQKYDAPFAIYIPTSFADRAGELWWLTLEAAIARVSRLALVMDGEDRRFDCHSAEEKYELFEHIYWWLRSLESEI